MLRIRFLDVGDDDGAEATGRVGWEGVPWDGPIKGYALNFIKRVVWQFMNRCEPDDLLQEAWLVYNRLCEAYPHISVRKHFMALFKTALYRHFINYNRKLNRFPDVVSLAVNEDGETTFPLEATETGIEQAEVNLFRDLAPEPVRNVIRQLCHGEIEPRYQWQDNVRETTREFLTRLAGCAQSAPIVEMILEYVEPKEIAT